MFPFYLNCGFGRPIGAELLDQVLELGFDGVRQDVPDDHPAAEAVLRELAERPDVKAIFLLAGGKMTREHPLEGKPAWKPDELVAHVDDVCIKLRDFGFFSRPDSQLPALEPGNEPDLAEKPWKKEEELLARTLTRCYEVIRKYSYRVPVLSPSVSNLNERGFGYLEKMTRAGIPTDADVAVHRYPNGPRASTPHEGFDSRGAEVSKLLRLAGGRPIWITETGMREGPHGRGAKPSYLEEDQVAEAFEEEMKFWARVPQVRGVVWYQLNDGPDRTNEYHSYGIRRLNGEWKAVAQRVAEVKRKLEEVSV